MSACTLLSGLDALSSAPAESTREVDIEGADSGGSGKGRIDGGGESSGTPDDGSTSDGMTPTDAMAGADGEPSPTEPILGSKTVYREYWYNTPPGVPADAFEYVAHYTGMVRTIAFFLDERTTAGSTVQVGLYSASDGRPGTLLTFGTLSSAARSEWNTVSVSPTAVTGGQRYWIAFLNPNGVATLSLRIASQGGLAVESAPDLPTLPTTWTTDRTFDGSPASAYALP